MNLSKLGSISESEIQIIKEKISDEFEVSTDLQGNIQIYNLIEEYRLPQEEIHNLLLEL